MNFPHNINFPNTPNFIQPICPIGPKVWNRLHQASVVRGLGESCELLQPFMFDQIQATLPRSFQPLDINKVLFCSLLKCQYFKRNDPYLSYYKHKNTFIRIQAPFLRFRRLFIGCAKLVFAKVYRVSISTCLGTLRSFKQYLGRIQCTFTGGGVLYWYHKA